MTLLSPGHNPPQDTKAHFISLGLKNISTDEFGYVYATIPSNTDKKVPVICFCFYWLLIKSLISILSTI